MGQYEVILIERLKPAFLDILPTEQGTPPLLSAKQHSVSPPSSATVTVTHYGHKVHWPRCLSSTIIHYLSWGSIVYL